MVSLTSFTENGTTSQSNCKLVSTGPASSAKGATISRHSNITEPFHVIDDLHHDVILGETLPAAVDAYNQHADNIQHSDVDAGWLIAIGRKKKSGEGKGKFRPSMDEEQRFRDDFSLDWDRHTKQEEVIEDQLRQKRITEEQSRIKHYEEYQSHPDWLRTHRISWTDFTRATMSKMCHRKLPERSLLRICEYGTQPNPLPLLQLL
jgi:hypothetical protein